MAEWVTQRQAAALLGVHPSAVPKMIRRGELHPRDRRPSLSRAEVLQLADARARPNPVDPPAPRPAWVARPPDDEHDWFTSDEAAEVLDLTRNGVNYRAQRDQLPHTWHDRRRWFRQDHLELLLRAQAARSNMQG